MVYPRCTEAFNWGLVSASPWGQRLQKLDDGRLTRPQLQSPRDRHPKDVVFPRASLCTDFGVKFRTEGSENKYFYTVSLPLIVRGDDIYRDFYRVMISIYGDDISTWREHERPSLLSADAGCAILSYLWIFDRLSLNAERATSSPGTLHASRKAVGRAFHGLGTWTG